MNIPGEKPTLVGVDGNAFSVMGYVTRHLKAAEVKPTSDKFETASKEYTTEATSGDYNHLLAVSCDYLDKAIEAYEASPDFIGWEDDEYADETYYDEDDDDEW